MGQERHSTRSSFLIAAVSVGAIIAFIAAALNFPTETPEDPAAAHRKVLAELDAAIDKIRAEAKPKLRVNSWRCYTEHGYWHVAGTVTNITSSNLDKVTAVATFETKEGQFVKTDDAMIDYQPIMPGQTSPFDVITTGNPSIWQCRLAFKHLFGAAIRIEQ